MLKDRTYDKEIQIIFTASLTHLRHFTTLYVPDSKIRAIEFMMSCELLRHGYYILSSLSLRSVY